MSTTDGTDGNFVDIQNANNTTGVMSGIRFQNGTSATTFKGGIFYRDVASWGTGDLIIANNSTMTAGDVSASDARMIFQKDGRVMVKGDPNTDINTAIFAVQNSDGDTIFAVYPEGVRIWVNDDGGSKANGSRGGFAVGGFSPAKAGFTNEYLRVTPDSVRVYIDDSFVTSKANGSRGGFAVGGFSPAKGTLTDHYLFVQDDSTRVYVADSLQGFGVENIEGATDQRIMRLTSENYFIGHQAGISMITGQYNTVFGYKAASMTTGGSRNTILGYMTGCYNNGYDNVLIGDSAGYLSSGYSNIFIGTQAGRYNISPDYCIFIGTKAGYRNNDGECNTFLGHQSGMNNTNGNYNLFSGFQSGINSNGSFNVFVGPYSATNTTSGNFNTFLGAYGGTNNTTGSSNVYIG
ncbi:MAG: hypothetical protein ABIJ16_05575, partial [Bacteroidota bacterium]